MIMLNPAQKRATNPDISARVMANAGSGKTSVLTARVLRLLLKGVLPGKILCLTYTKAAAAEMRARINAQLEEWVLMDEASLRQELAQLIEAEPDAKQMTIARRLFSATLESSPPPRIQTIHSFCQDVLKRFPLESGIQPYFEVVDDITSKELIKETTQVLLSKHNQEMQVGQAVDYIAAEAGESKFNDVVSEIINQRNRLRDLFAQYNGPEEIINFIYGKHGLDIAASAEELAAGFFEFGPERKDYVGRMTAAMQKSANKNDGLRGREIAAALRDKDFATYSIAFLTKENTPRKVIITKQGQQYFGEAEEVIAYEQEMLMAAVDSITMIENLRFTSHVIYLAFGILETYDALKRARAVIDYNDLIYSTKLLLTSAGNAAWVLYKLDGGLEHILVDEAQDTSPEQWQIILAILDEFMAGEGARARERTIFIVGDEKQSIYSFQGADQKMFNEVVAYIQKKCVEAQKDFSDLPILTSFRSVEAVLRLVDETFAPESLRQSISSIPRAIAHELNRKGDGGHVEIWPIIRNEEREELEDWQLPTSYITAKSSDLLLAEKISDTIRDWLASGRVLASQNRAVRPSDILILLRSRGNLADMLINRLKKNNIPVSGSDRLRITEHIAIQDLLALGNFLLLPADDLSLAAALKSPLFGINEDDLFELSYQREGSLWNSIRAKPKYKKLEEVLSELLGRVDYGSVYELYSYILDQSGGRKKMLSRLGHEVNDILDEFLDLAVNFERSHTSSLQHFISWVALSNMEIKRDMEGANDEVRIMTVHGAKGLEAPIVFIADAAKLPQPKKQLIWDVPHFYSYKTKTRIFNRLRESVDAGEAAEYDEYLRLLYVAITRARDELYICGSVGERNTNIDKSWYKVVENSLSNFGAKDGVSGVIKYQTAHEKPAVETAAAIVKPQTTLPDFLNKKLAGEKPVINDLEEDFSEKIEEIDYGKKVHKALEILSRLPESAKTAYMEARFGEDEKTVVSLNTLFANPELSGIFGPDSRAEVPLAGVIDGRIITGRIDRLLVENDEITIVDFKTSRNIPAQIPISYINQMDTYAKLVSMQFPGRRVRRFLLWTAHNKLTELA